MGAPAAFGGRGDSRGMVIANSACVLRMHRVHYTQEEP
jgi:hypothetical protein